MMFKLRILLFIFNFCLTLSLFGETAFLPESTPISLDVGSRIAYSIVEEGQDPQVLFIDEQGFVNVPILGKIQAKGMDIDTLSLSIKQALEKEYYKKATVVITPYTSQTETRGKVFMMGQVNSQGPVDIPNNELLTVTKAILAAGGFTPLSDPSSVTVVRDNPNNPSEKIKNIINVHDILEQGDLSKDMVLHANDVLFVSEKGDLNGKVFVVGEIKSPGYYGIPPGKDLTISQAILAAGGFTEFSNQTTVKLVRADQSLPEKDKKININAEKIFKKGDRTQDYKLQNNDMIIVDEKWINF